MATKARLVFKPIDYAYQDTYGIMPDYDFTNRLKAGQPLEEVSALIEKRMAGLYEQMRYEHDNKEMQWQDVPEGECPFK